jgi:REP-associated tyrosine transposase
VGRPPRPTEAGIYHAGSRSPHGLPFFHDPEDYFVFVGHLAGALLRERCTCLAFCLMTTHYHLLLEVGDGALPRMMKRLNWHYARCQTPISVSDT